MADIAPDPVLGGHEKQETDDLSFSDGDVLQARRVDQVKAAHITAQSPGNAVSVDVSSGADNEVTLNTSAGGSIDAYVTVIGS